jgi:hypothetical protein
VSIEPRITRKRTDYIACPLPAGTLADCFQDVQGSLTPAREKIFGYTLGTLRTEGN